MLLQILAWSFVVLVCSMMTGLALAASIRAGRDGDDDSTYGADGGRRKTTDNL